MREAVGGSLLYYLIIPIILLIIFFIGFIMNYASAYRAANYIITQIENCQGRFNDCAGIDMKTIKKRIESDYGYVEPDHYDITPCYFVNGNNTVFRVSLPVYFTLPIFGDAIPMYVKAETKSISKVPENSLAVFKSKCSN